jgi:hypothetical protein
MDLGDLLKKPNSLTVKIFEANGIAVDIIADEKNQSMMIDPQILKALLLISKEMLNNSVKYSGRGVMGGGLFPDHWARSPWKGARFVTAEVFNNYLNHL